MIALRFAPRARADVESIWNYTAQKWSVNQAEAYLLAIDEAVEPIAREPPPGT